MAATGRFFLVIVSTENGYLLELHQVGAAAPVKAQYCSHGQDEALVIVHNLLTQFELKKAEEECLSMVGPQKQ